MKKRTLITLAVFLILGTVWFIYSSVTLKSDFEKAKDLDVRVTYNEEEFNEAIKSDGTIYALGEIYGAVDFDSINFDDLEFKGKDKEEKIELFESQMTGGRGYLYLEIFSVQVSKKTQKVESRYYPDEYEYKEVYTIDRYGNTLVYVADSFEFYGKKFPFTESLAKFIGLLNQSFVPEKAKEHFIRAEYLPSGASVWVEFEIVNGELLEDSLKLHSDYGHFDVLAREISGENTYSIGLNLVSIIFITLILFAITTFIQRKFF